MQHNLQQLGNQQNWLDWIDEFGSQVAAAKDLTDINKKQFINSVVKDILVDYDQSEKLHHLRINFRLPVLASLGGILRENDVVLKRGRSSIKRAESIDNTVAPGLPKSALLHGHRLCQVPWLVYITAAHNGYMVSK